MSSVHSNDSPTKETAMWDKIFAQSDTVEVERVSYQNRYGVRVSADFYLPKALDSTKKYPALVVGTPYGA